MAEPVTATEAPPPQAEEQLGLNPELVALVAELLDDEHRFEARLLVEPLRPPELADLLQQLRADKRELLVEFLRPDFHPEVLPELEPGVRDEVAAQLGTRTLARAIARLDTDDALNLLSTLEESSFS